MIYSIYYFSGKLEGEGNKGGEVGKENPLIVLKSR